MIFFPTEEQVVIKKIKYLTQLKNKDNITRTDSYFSFFKSHPEIRWSFLASMVSRNGGYNMCDLEGEYFSQLLEPHIRERLFLTYERANWLIFQDVYPQLMVYDYSTKIGRPLFHLLKYFCVSDFIKNEWIIFWSKGDKTRLMNALIINEQNVIQKPIIEHPVYKKKVFHSALFQFEDWLHFSSVLFPTCSGELYGASVNGFRKLDKRIDLGKRLADILFHSKLFPYFFEFAKKQTHTGSRFDYERYFQRRVEKKTPYLRVAFPIISHHIHEKKDWSKEKRVPHSWLHGRVKHRHPIHITEWFETKQNQLNAMAALKKLLT